MGKTIGRTAKACALALVAAAGYARAELVINESAGDYLDPYGSANTDRDNAAEAKPGGDTVRVSGHWFSGDEGESFLRRTEKGPPQRTTSVYTGSVFRTDRDFSVRMEMRMPDSKDYAVSISFFWLDAASFTDIAKSIGGEDGWSLRTRGDAIARPDKEREDENLSDGFAAGLKGYALNFDLESEDGAERGARATLVDLRDRSPVADAEIDFSSDRKSDNANGWQTVGFGYDADADHYTLGWGYDGSSFKERRSYPAAGTEKFTSAYVGFRARTDRSGHSQDVRNIVLQCVPAAGPAAVPEPGTWAAAALLVAGAALMRWRKCRGAGRENDGEKKKSSLRE